MTLIDNNLMTDRSIILMMASLAAVIGLCHHNAVGQVVENRKSRPNTCSPRALRWAGTAGTRSENKKSMND